LTFEKINNIFIGIAVSSYVFAKQNNQSVNLFPMSFNNYEFF